VVRLLSPVTLRKFDGGRRPIEAAAARQGVDELNLVRLWLRGDRQAALALWDHFMPLVRALLARALGPGERLADALQEIFLRIFHKGRTLRDPERLRGFVVTITVHYIRSEFRKSRLRRFVQLPLGRHPPEQLVVRVEPEARLAVGALYRALDDLPTDERLAFTLRFFEGMEITEAAALMGISAATFKRRLAAAKRRLWAATGEDPWLAPYLAVNGGRPGGGNA
jgi:RNA polymerase sigma-70 factor, ECF subfamily